MSANLRNVVIIVAVLNLAYFGVEFVGLGIAAMNAATLEQISN